MFRIISMGVAMLLAAPAIAQQAATGAPDIGAGKRRAATCFACHNVDGISRIPGTPHLAGQERGYLETTLRAYRDGQTRLNPTMNAMAKPLSDRDIVNIAAYYSLQTRMNNGQTAAATLETLERIRPVGTVASAAELRSGPADYSASKSPAAKRTGDAIYSAACAACHATGAAGAPKAGARPDWLARVPQGTATLVKHAVQGYKGMPARGGCANCSDTEIKAAVEYLLGTVK